jgi:hypothetical protein
MKFSIISYTIGLHVDKNCTFGTKVDKKCVINGLTNKNALGIRKSASAHEFLGIWPDSVLK